MFASRQQLSGGFWRAKIARRVRPETDAQHGSQQQTTGKARHSQVVLYPLDGSRRERRARRCKRGLARSRMFWK
jgi:hypothetical protein